MVRSEVCLFVPTDIVLSAQYAMDWSPSYLFLRVALDLKVVSMYWKHLYLDQLSQRYLIL